VCTFWPRMETMSFTGAVAMYCDEYVCLCVCLSARISPEPHARSLPIFVHVAYVRGSVLLWHVDDRPHRLSLGMGDGSAQRGRSVIYDCLRVRGVTPSTKSTKFGSRYLGVFRRGRNLAV